MSPDLKAALDAAASAAVKTIQLVDSLRIMSASEAHEAIRATAPLLNEQGEEIAHQSAVVLESLP